VKGAVSIDRPAVRAALVIAAVVLFVIALVRLPRPQADTLVTVMADELPQIATSMSLVVNQNGSLEFNGIPLNETVRRTVVADEVRLPVIDDSLDYWPALTVTLKLPAPALEGPGMIVPYAIHGAQVGPMEISADRQTIVFHFSPVETGSSVSVVVQMARGSVALGPRAWLNSFTSAVDPSRWWLIGIAIPLISSIIFNILSPTKRRRPKDAGETERPPSNLSPAAVGLLVEERVNSNQLAATLLKLAIEGDIQLVSTVNGYRIARRRNLEHLTPLEQLIVDELRLKLKPINNQEVIEEEQQHRLFSQKITAAISSIYQELEYRGFFARGYRAQRTLYRFIGLITIALAIGGALLSAVVIMDGILLLPVFFGIFLSGWSVLVLAPHLPRFTSVGRREREQWIAFRAYLSSASPLAGGQEILRMFELYLPYAVTFGVSTNWLHRFKAEFITIPEWYFSEQNPGSTELFVSEMENIVTKIGRTLTASAIPE